MSGNTQATYNEQQVTDRLTGELGSWELRDGQIQRTFKTSGWPMTLLLVNAIGYVAEAASHHPDLVVSYAQVVVRLSTHSAGGVTDKDLDLARKIEALGVL